MSVLTIAEPQTSYRTPLSLEAGLLSLFEAIRNSSTCICEKPIAITNELTLGCNTPASTGKGVKKSTSVVGFTTLDGIVNAETAEAETKSPNKRRTPNRKKGDVGVELG